MAILTDKPQTGKRELSVEEIKALRLCKCGNYKHGRYSECDRCYLLFSGDEELERAFYEGIKKVQSRKMEYAELFKLIEGSPIQRKALMIKMLMHRKIKVSQEDFILCRKNIERRGIKRQGFVVEGQRQEINKILSRGPTIYRGFNTAP